MVRGGVARVSTAVDIPLASADLPRPPAGPLLRDGGCAHGGICIRRCAEQRALPLPASSTESAAGGGAAGAGSSGGRGGRNCGDGARQWCPREARRRVAKSVVEGQGGERGEWRCSTLLTIAALFVNGDSRVDVGNNHDSSHRFLRADLPLYGMSYIEALERFSDGRLKINYLAASPPSRFPPPHPPSPPPPPFPCFPPISPVLHCSPSPPARYLGLPSPPPVLQQGHNASRGLYFARAESHTLDHRLLDAIHGSEGGYIVGGADSFYSRMAEQDAQAPRMGECGGRCGTGDGSSLIESLIKYPPLEEVRGLPEEIVGDEKEDMDFADVDASVEGEEDEDDGV
ncbi:unnamed protein product [Closterium sp. NIES-65]|nr:unnamed protein product [Closterium sp. NIES-65]